MKRATYNLGFFFILNVISIHALVKRATCDGLGIFKSYKDFNPRPREEGDLGYLVTCKMQNDFNPRPREEGDVLDRLKKEMLKYFNPRPREEGD